MKSTNIIICIAMLFSLNCTNKNESNSKLQENSEKENTKTVFKDDFENGLQDFWVAEAVDSTRYKIVPDPLNKENKVLKVDLNLEDYANGGRRSEMAIMKMDELDYLAKYNFRFLLPNDFFKKDEKPGMIIIHQWHDQADPGFSWSTQNKITHPPIYLFIDRKENGIYDLIFRTGLETGDMNETVSSVWSEKLKPNHWYTFKCEILWHIYSDTGYALPILDGKPFYSSNEANGEIAHKIYRRNMYNGIGNYPKIGLYKFGNEKYDRTIYFDDFSLESEKIKCPE